MLDQFSRTGDFHTAIVKNAMKIVATVQMVRSFIQGPPVQLVRKDSYPRQP
jgi:hypothetical protein